MMYTFSRLYIDPDIFKGRFRLQTKTKENKQCNNTIGREQ